MWAFVALPTVASSVWIFHQASFLAYYSNAIVPEVVHLLKQKHMDDVMVIVGGTIPDADAAKLCGLLDRLGCSCGEAQMLAARDGAPAR